MYKNENKFILFNIKYIGLSYTRFPTSNIVGWLAYVAACEAKQQCRPTMLNRCRFTSCGAQVLWEVQISSIKVDLSLAPATAHMHVRLIT